MQNKNRHLRLIPYTPEDYSIGQVLLGDNQAVLDDPSLVSSVLSLYFQWEEHRSAVIILQDNQSLRHIRCELDYDRDERVATEIRILFQDENPPIHLQDGAEIRIRFEVFRICYEMTSVVLAISDNPQEDGFSLIITPPERVITIKGRKIRRVPVLEEYLSKLPSVAFRHKDSSELIQIVPKELGSNSIAGEAKGDINDDFGSIVIDEYPFPARVVRKFGSNVIIQLMLETGEESGKYFDFYRIVAFPALRPKVNYTDSELNSLYLQAGYFDKFGTPEDQLVRQKQINEVWDIVRAENHRYTADYVVLNQDDNITGASSVVNAFEFDEKPVWVFHQLCALTDPSVLEQSGQLYTWRAEYLASRPESLSVCGWFDSGSRWLERIYVKFAKYKTGESKVKPVNIVRVKGKLLAERAGDTANLSYLKSGCFNRTLLSKNDLFGGVGLRHLNASGILDALISMSPDTPNEEIEKFASNLVKGAKDDVPLVEITLPQGEISLDIEYSTVDDCDRFIWMTKEDLSDFVSSVEHSLAVTIRRKGARN